MRSLTTLTSKGQLTIPSHLREKMNLENGDVFVVLGKKNTLVLSKISSREEVFEDLLKPFKKTIKKLERAL